VRLPGDEMPEGLHREKPRIEQYRDSCNAALLRCPPKGGDARVSAVSGRPRIECRRERYCNVAAGHPPPGSRKDSEHTTRPTHNSHLARTLLASARRFSSIKVKREGHISARGVLRRPGGHSWGAEPQRARGQISRRPCNSKCYLGAQSELMI
jgi:hypothetical protein